MGYSHSWKWSTCIADANRFAAWSRDIAYLQTYMATPGKLLPWEVPFFSRRLESGQLEYVYKWSENEAPPIDVWEGVALISEPQPFPPLIIRGSEGQSEPIFTSTEVLFNGDCETRDSLQDFHITFEQLQASHEHWCKTNRCSYDMLVRCAIVRFAHYFPTVRVFSDGEKVALEIPVRICRYVFEDETAFPLWAYEDDDNEG